MMVNLEKLYETLLFYAAHGWDEAICKTTGCRSDAEAEVFNLIIGPTRDRELLISFYSSLLSGEGYQYTRDEFRETGVEDTFPMLTEHLMLSVYS